MARDQVGLRGGLPTEVVEGHDPVPVGFLDEVEGGVDSLELIDDPRRRAT
jgi:hypothetical protein